MAEQQETPEHCQPGLLQVVREITDNSRRLMQGIVHRRCAVDGAAASDPLHLGPTILELSARVLADPALVLQAQLALWQDHLRLWHNTGQRLLGLPVEPMIEPEQSDRRFRDPAWDDHAVFDFIKQSYLLILRAVWSIRSTRSRASTTRPGGRSTSTPDSSPMPWRPATSW